MVVVLELTHNVESLFQSSVNFSSYELPRSQPVVLGCFPSRAGRLPWQMGDVKVYAGTLVGQVPMWKLRK